MTPQKAPRPLLLTSAQAQQQLGVGRTKFYELVATGELAVVPLPSASGKRRELRVEAAEVDAFIARNRQRAAS